MTELKYTKLKEEQKEQVLKYILDYLKGKKLPELVLSKEKSLKTQMNKEGHFELVLQGTFIPQDAVKNTIAKLDVSETSLLEYTPDKSKLVIGTHERLDGVFNDLKKLMAKEISWSEISRFEDLEVTEHDFFGKGFIVASLNYPVNKMNRLAAHQEGLS